ncbi:MAG: glycosyltransferase family 2 protein [Planctomycetota bacterium]
MLSRHHDTLVIIPAWNEAGRVGDVLRGLAKHGVEADVLVIDDGSDDNTGGEARRLGAQVIRHPYNLGYGTALQTGYIYARKRDYDKVVQMDADGQHDPASVQTLLDSLADGADLALGSRFLDGDPPPMTLPRRLGSRLFAWIVTKWTGTRITDPTSGFQALSRCVLREVVQDSFPEDFPDADVLISLSRSGLKLKEVPVRMYERKGGVSMHRGSKSAYYAYKMLLTLALMAVRRVSPFRSPHTASAQAS